MPDIAPPPETLVATSYLRLLLKQLPLPQDEVEHLLAEGGVDPEALLRLNSHIALERYVGLLGEILRRIDDPGLALRTGQQLHIATHGPIGIAAYTSSTLGEALSTIARFYSIRGQFIDIRLATAGSDLLLEVSLRGDFGALGLFLLEAFLASAQSGIEFITGAPPAGARLDLGYPAPPHAALYHDFFHMPVHFGRERTVVTLPLALLQTPSLHADPVLKLQAEQQCEQLFRDLQLVYSSATSRVVSLLRNNPGKLWTAADVAGVLGLSERTLMRRLKEEGQGYQQLLDAELERQARIHLQDPRHTAESLALTLGYTDLSGFRRAFKRWFGVSLREFQAQRGADAGR